MGYHDYDYEINHVKSQDPQEQNRKKETEVKTHAQIWMSTNISICLHSHVVQLSPLIHSCRLGLLCAMQSTCFTVYIAVQDALSLHSILSLIKSPFTL